MSALPVAVVALVLLLVVVLISQFNDWRNP